MATESRTKRMEIRLTPTEQSDVEARAKAANVTVATYVRESIVGRPVSEETAPEAAPSAKPAKADVPLDPDGEPIFDKAVSDAAEDHGEKFWAKADEIEGSGLSRTMARHLAAQELGRRPKEAVPHNDAIRAAHERNRAAGAPEIGDYIGEHRANVPSVLDRPPLPPEIK